MEHIAELTLLYKASRIHMFNADICKFSANLDEQWAKAETMGFNLMQVLKIKTLIDQAKFMTAYNNCIMNLHDNGHGTNYNMICAALFKQQDDMVTKPNHRIDSGKATQAFAVSSKFTNQDTYSMGKPGLDGQRKCYYCQGENHISQFCPKNPNNKLHTINNTTTTNLTNNETPA